MASGRPMIGEIELELVQKIETDEDQVLVQHSVPALEGDFLQHLGRRASRIKLSGVMTGPESAESLKTLRAKFRDGEPASFVADIATATQVGDVLIEEFGVRELAGKAERFAYELTLRELIAPPAPQTEPPPPVPPDPVPPDVAELEVEVIVEGQEDFDYSKVTVTVAGTSENSGDAADGAATVTAGTTVNRTLTNRTGNVWLDDQMPPGQFTATAVTDDPQMTGSAGVVLGRGERKRVTITLRPGAVVAKAFIVHFWFDKSFVEPCMREVLQQVARYAQAHSNEKLAIIGHADKQGGFPPAAGALDYNQSLSERRARSVYSYLTAGRDRQASLDEWNALRVKRPVGELPSVKDSWGTREYQYILQDLGYYSGNITEIHLPGDQTDTAVRAFQNDNGLTADGIVGDATWAALIDKYIGQDNLAVPESQFFPNARDGCDAGILKWIGASEHDSVRNTQDAWRPNRRVEMLFIAANQITCKVPKPVTFHLPPPNGAGSAWCLDNGSTTSSDFGKPPCFTTRDESSATAEKWLIQPAEPGTFIVSGRITFEDGTPAAGIKYVLIAPDGEFMDGEVPGGVNRGRPIKGITDANGEFSYPDKPKGIGIYTLEIEGPFVARAADESPSEAKGNVVCIRLDGSSGGQVIITGVASSLQFVDQNDSDVEPTIVQRDGMMRVRADVAGVQGDVVLVDIIGAPTVQLPATPPPVTTTALEFVAADNVENLATSIQRGGTMRVRVDAPNVTEDTITVEISGAPAIGPAAGPPQPSLATVAFVAGNNVETVMTSARAGDALRLRVDLPGQSGDEITAEISVRPTSG